MWRAVIVLSVLLLLMALVSWPILADEWIYVVKPGDTLWGIATRFGVSPYTLARLNNISPTSWVYVGQRLRIPDGQSHNASDRIYVVRRGDTLTGIAQRFGVSVAALARANGLSPTSYVYIGQRLRIPSGGQVGSPAPAPNGRVYVVQPGDTLSGIARRFGVSLSALIQANRISRPSLIYVGQRLIIPRAEVTLAPQGNGLQFIVSVSRQTCWLYRGQQLLYTWRCSTGRPGYPTRYGVFHVQSKIPVAYGSTWNIYMPYWLGIYWVGSVENGIHGLPWNATTGVKVWSGLVGTPITFGCIMLDDWAAKTLYDMAYIGMPVIIRP